MVDGRLRIRVETQEDWPAVHAVHHAAFGQQAEADLVDALRSSTAFVPGLSLVAECDGQVVGHILFTCIKVIAPDGAAHDALTLAPLAVLPAFQDRGFGSALVERGLATCRALGHVAVIVLGHPEYYPRFRFVPASRYGIMSPFPAPEEAFMALELSPGALNGVQGTVRYPPEFDNV